MVMTLHVRVEESLMGLEQLASACLRVWRAGILVSCFVSGFAWLVSTDAHPRGRITLAANGSLPGTKANQPQARLAATYGKLPLTFEANHGQTDNKVKFLARGRDYALFLTATEAVLSFKKRAEPGGDDELSPKTQVSERESGDSGTRGRPSVLVDMKLVGGNPAPEVSGLERLPSTANYFIGNDPKKWHTNVPTYAKVRYRDVYPGIDLVYYGNQGQLEYDFVVEPGADPRTIRLTLQGGGRLKLDAQGDLVLGEVRFRKPRLYQETAGDRQDVSGRYVLKGARQVAFQVASYDASRPLMIDPVLSYSTVLGGSNFDQINGIAVDSSGKAYVAGFTSSSPFPTTSGAFDATYGGSSDVFVSKFNPSVSGSSSLIYSTYIGGSFGEQALAIAVDSSGVAYVAGQALSSNFPTTAGAFDTTYNGNGDAFLLKLSATGSSLLYSTYLGGSGLDQALGVALDSSGNIYMAGQTFSTNFPTLNALQTANGGLQDSFVAEFTNSGSPLYSTYLGGSGYDQANGIAVDALGRAYVTGYTTSPDFPVHNAPAVGAACSSCANNTNDAFVAAIGANGTGFVYSTYLGGSGDDQGMGIAVDAVGNAYVTGSTFSTNFPTTVGAYQRSLLGSSSAFVTLVDTNGSTLGYSTYVGSGGNTYGQAIAVAGGNAYIGGSTNASSLPLVGAIQSGNAGGVDAFAAEINPAGSAISFSTYFGGSAYDQVTAVAINSGNMYIAGSTHSTDLPTAQAYQGSYGGGDSDAFLAKIQISTVSLSPGSLTFSAQQVDTTSPPQPVTLTNSGSSSLSITSITFTGSNSGDFAQTNNCGSSVPQGASCTINVTFTPAASGPRSATLTVNDNAFGSPHTASVAGT